MEHALSCWEKTKGQFGGKHLILFLDYDGTLAPIAATPDKAVLPRETKALLLKLRKSAACSIMIVSGRSLADVKKRVGLPGITYVGNHGLEVEGPGIKSQSPVPPSCRVVMGKITRELERRLSSVPGVVVEDKTLTISVHYRLAPPKALRAIRKDVVGVVGPHVREKKVRLTRGKKVFEIKPLRGWDKGKMVEWLLARQYFLLGERPIGSIYIGDDVTDEDAFKALADKGLTVFVGRPAATVARCYLRDTGEVRRFLEEVLAERRI